jgi:hypothetical protein
MADSVVASLHKILSTHAAGLDLTGLADGNSFLPIRWKWNKSLVSK